MGERLGIIEDELSGTQIAALIALHFEEMHQFSPADSCHVMTADRLRSPDVTFFSAWDGDVPAGCGAIKQLDPAHGSCAPFEPALGLYRSHGFVACAPFAAYRENPFSRFLTLKL